MRTIKCYKCPIQDYCPTANPKTELAENHPGVMVGTQLNTLSDDSKSSCPLYRIVAEGGMEAFLRSCQ